LNILRRGEASKQDYCFDIQGFARSRTWPVFRIRVEEFVLPPTWDAIAIASVDSVYKFRIAKLDEGPAIDLSRPEEEWSQEIEPFVVSGGRHFSNGGDITTYASREEARMAADRVLGKLHVPDIAKKGIRV
jgi:hypothetical protein